MTKGAAIRVPWVADSPSKPAAEIHSAAKELTNVARDPVETDERVAWR